MYLISQNFVSLRTNSSDMKRTIVLSTMAMLLTMACMAQQQDKMVVKTESGLVKGIDQEGSMGFLGIPYARVERFMPPQPVKKWKGVRVCDHWGPMTMQQTNRPMSEDEMSEQCCVLNVWTTDLKAKKPVMFWLHGGGFDSGTSAWDPGMCLAKKDVVVVSINHRLNILGFLDLSTCGKKYKYSGNVGMLDAVRALEWVRDNIANFGGDPNNVTIFGESGGGGKVGTLMCMPKAKGLFHKAIIMSGTILNVNTKAMTEELGEAVLKELGLTKKTVDKLKDVSYKDLYAAGQRAMAASIGTRRPGTPMMWGTTFNELQRARYGQKVTFEQARKELERTFGDETDAYISAYMEAYPLGTLERLPQDLLCIDWLFRPKTIITADAIGGKRKADTYVYMYTVKEGGAGEKGSAHGAELKYCFDVLHHYTNQLSAAEIANNKPWADLLSDVWAHFAHTGNPDSPEIRNSAPFPVLRSDPAWVPYTKENGCLMQFGDPLHFIRYNHDRKLEEIIDRHCFKQLDEFRKTHPSP